MLTTLLVVQVIISISMVAIILLQRSSSDGLSGLSGGGNSLVSGRASANALTKSTAFLAVAFMVNSMAMAVITARSTGIAETVIEELSAEPLEPAVPIAE